MDAQARASALARGPRSLLRPGRLERSLAGTKTLMAGAKRRFLIGNVAAFAMTMQL